MKALIISFLTACLLVSSSLAVNPPYLLMITNYDGEQFNLIPDTEGNPLAQGNLIHLILDVDDNGISLPLPEGDNLGYPSEDDQLIAEFTLEAYGGVDQAGAFLYALTAGTGVGLVESGDKVYIRAFNSNELTEDTYYCNSESTYEIPGFSEPLLTGITFPESMTDPVTPSIERELTVPLSTGWNMISINVNPNEELYRNGEARGPDIVLMTNQLRDENRHHLELMKDEDGRFYLPAFGFNNIPYWDLTQGYQVKVDQDIDAIWIGEPISPDADIQLEELWNLIAYFPTYELDARAPGFYALSPIIDHVLIAKDTDGRFMLPAFNFSNMLPWQETQGYQVKVDEELVLNYPEEQQEVAVIGMSDSPGDQDKHWNSPAVTGVNSSILITNISGIEATPNDQIAAYNTDHKLVGVGEINADGFCGLALWGDDPSTDQVDGLKDNEPFILKLWNVASQNIYDLELQELKTGAGLSFSENGLIVAGLRIKVAIPDNYYLSGAFPNPFNSLTNISYGLPESVKLRIQIYDISGRLIENLYNGFQTGGHHVINWDSENASTGIYLVLMEADDFRSVIKIMLVR